jgi:ABC-2 type transport system ATP-binding protein
LDAKGQSRYAIEALDVYKTYPGDVTALGGVTLSVLRGEIFALLGPNGAGKTTLFKIALGIARLTSGRVEVDGLTASDPESRRRVGYLPENHQFPSYLTGNGLVTLAGRLRGMSGSEIHGVAPGLLDLVGMSKWADREIKTYSKGMLQRVGLAQALAANPQILFLDEPTDGVDPVGKIEIRQLLQKLRAEGKTILINSHLLSEVESIADRVAILDKGRVMKIGSIGDLTSRGSQYEIQADLKNVPIAFPPEIGRALSISADTLALELKDGQTINSAIDFLRSQDIAILSVKPIKISLEQSFIETISGCERTKL